MKKFSIDYSFLIVLCLIALSPKQDTLVKLLIALCVHELGHLAWIGFFRYRIESLRLSIFGFFLKLDATKEELFKDICIYYGGILANLLCFLFVPDPVFKKINLLFLCFNALPIYPLDGFQGIRCILAYFIPYQKVLKITAIFSMLSSTIAFVLCLCFKMDVFILLNSAYLIILSLEYYFKLKAIYQSFLLRRSLYPFEYPIKRIAFPDSIEGCFYKYHQVVFMIENKKITEADLLLSKNMLK